MNQVNPLHIGGLLLVMIMFLFFELSGAKEGLKEAKSEFLVSEELAIDLHALKSVYADTKKIKNSINRILANQSIKKANLSVKRGKKFIHISSKSVDTEVLNRLMDKVLNASFNITTLKIKRLSETKASLEMEIKW
ncbi:hypothetical protein JHD47_07980 [Sulfurimonas sp. SAG-AH-194-L11]|nr:hypothetical protein [Sulfurimonas sp. SAG-AH-194-L11]MDF1877753.1 hypothetical protein [Sulfurimonas sp. SAG-AH-194-L11]